MKPHPFAEIFPMMSADEIKKLAADIKENGQRDPIVRYRGLVLDGRNRLKACEVAKVRPIFEDYEGDDPLGYVYSKNFVRRHLNESQRAIAAAKWMTELNAQLKAANLPVDEPTQADAAKRFKVSERSVRDAKKVLDDGSKATVKKVVDGKQRVYDAASEIRSYERAKAIVEAADADPQAFADDNEEQPQPKPKPTPKPKEKPEPKPDPAKELAGAISEAVDAFEHAAKLADKIGVRPPKNSLDDAVAKAASAARDHAARIRQAMREAGKR